VAAKLCIRIGHVEAGLRAFDRTMPEEINRMLTDQLADILFTPSGDGNANLKHEGIADHKIHLVGNVMIDTLIRLLHKAKRPDVNDLPDHYALATLHRPSNVDDPAMLDGMMKAFERMSRHLPILFPVHPRTRARMASLRDAVLTPGVRLMDPVGYLEFLWLQQHASAVITDSGGIQEETTYLGIPCLTVRENTERPVTVDVGTNILVGRDFRRLQHEFEQIVNGHAKQGKIPPLWDGKAAERIAHILLKPDAQT
jgi:UDP-N-acetylglucosamine 2-epimerase (non-hydrolysing)